VSVQFIHLANLFSSIASHDALIMKKLKEGKITTLETFWKKQMLVKLLDANPDMKIFLDSGAHSLLNAQVGLINKGDTVKTEKKVEDDKITFTSEEFEDRLTINQKISYAAKKTGAVQFFADWSFNKKPDVRKYLDEYIEFIHKYKNQLLGYVNLDIIYNAEESFENQQYMESNGLRPIPVFHYGEDFKWLEHYVNNYDYIGIGGVAGGITLQQFVQSLGNRAFEYISHTNPGIKVHGFAVTSISLMQRFSWYSVDSVSGDSCLLIREAGRIRVETIQDLFNCVDSEKCKLPSGLGHEYKVPQDVEVYTVDEDGKGVWRLISKVIRHNIRRKRFRIKTRTGRSLVLTPDHGLFLKKGQEVQCVPSSVIVPGDICVGVDYHDSLGSLAEVVLEVERKTFSKRNYPQTIERRKLPTKVVLDDTFLELCGLWIADGSYSSLGKNPSVQISAGNDIECFCVGQKIAERFHRSIRLGANKVDFTIHSIQLVRVMQELMLTGHSDTKEVPWWVFELSDAMIGAFLRGYFSGDGTITDNVECSTMSRKLLYGIFFLLQKLGIDARIYESKIHCNSLNIGAYSSLLRFKKLIGFLQQKKNNKLLQRIGEISEDRGIRSEKEQDEVYLKVTDVEEIPSESCSVFDLEVPGEERFVANGLLVHNSTTWLKHAAYGNVMVPNYDSVKRKFNYLCSPLIVSVSNISMVKSSKDHSHYTLAFPNEVVERIEQYFSEANVDPEKLKTDALERMKTNIYYYEQLLGCESIHQPSKYKSGRSFF